MAVKAAIYGTSVMTAFSYLLSEAVGENFREPELLAGLSRDLGSVSRKRSGIVGWAMHFGVGVGLAVLYETLLIKGYIRNNGRTVTAAGLVSGLSAVGAWKLALHFSKQKLKTNPARHYLQLIPAHLIFTFVAMEMLKKEQDYKKHIYGKQEIRTVGAKSAFKREDDRKAE